MRPLHFSFTMTREDLVLALGSLSPEDFVEIVKEVDGNLANWETIQGLKPYVDQQHRLMVEEETEEIAERTERCTRSAQYEDVWAHVNPHKGCVLR